MRYQNQVYTVDFPYKDAVLDDGDRRSFPHHCHKELEIMHVRKGSIKLLYNQVPYTLREGDIAIIPPYINHAFLSPESCERLVIEMAMDTSEGTGDIGRGSVLYQKALYKLCTISTAWPSETRDRVQGLIYNMHQEYTQKENAWEFAIQTVSDLLLLTAVRYFPEQTMEYVENDKSVKRLQKAIEYIANHYTERISLDECAKMCDFNSSYFSKYFKKHMGINFQDYVKNSRVEHAKWLLMTTNLPVTEVSWESGFSDIRVFNKIFKQETGETATGFRKRITRD